ncbi:hypothetical protein LA080_012584 [Diaporthe eres]|nr:hypothetical protein LA080_012584 [Diaporthe eres]
MANSWISISLAVLNALFFIYQTFTTPRDRYETVAPTVLNIIGRCKWLAASLCNGPRNCVITMSRHIKLVADNAKKDEWKKEILQQYGNLNTSATPCKQHSPVDGAKVYLYSKSLDGVNSSNLSTRGENVEDDQRGMRAPNFSVEELQQSGSENIQYWFIEALQELMEEAQYRHWIINIPTRDLAAHLHRGENSASSVIDIGPSSEILAGAAAMGVNLGGSQQQHLGHTCVSNDFINQLIEIENERRKASGQTDYSLTDNNCQTLWIQGMLDLIICNCNDRPRSTIFGAWPSTIAQRKEIMDWETAPAKLVMSLFLALAKRGNLSLLLGRPLRQPWYVTWSVFIVQQLEAASLVSEAIRSTDSLHPDPQGFPTFWILHVICGALSRGSTSWSSLFEFVDIAVGVGALLWAKHVRKRLQDQIPTQTGMYEGNKDSA